ncbi:hypothetical protein SAMN05660706_1074 [Desulfoscipio geothermicus DSM 3669]|uniref:Uncharacterized protein n=1 Tax=Desulfoscipio geothermicus DSM 3669 TaxID=1121426 RepID=A0A1I6D876_9FIRM|nr:hypothetical protein SAMN05660706_1074 [Desulfoscipio geothermicus DSM 3669]
MVQFRNDEQGLKNLDSAYKTVANIILKRIQDEKARQVKEVAEGEREIACSYLYKSQ